MAALWRTNYVASRSPELGAAAYGTASFDSATFAPLDNSLLVAIVGGASETDISATDYVVSGGSLSWTRRHTVQTSFAGYYSKLQVWTAPVTTGASMAVTVDHAASMHTWQVHVVGYTGYDTASPIGSIGDDTALEDAGTFNLSAAPAVTSVVIAARFLVPNEVTREAAEPGIGWAEIYDLSQEVGNGWGGQQTQTRTGSTSTAVNWVDTTLGTTAFTNIGLAVEIKAAPNAVASYLFKRKNPIRHLIMR